MAGLTVRVKEFSDRVNTLENTVNNIPDIEVELQQLDRDYQVVSQQHASLLKRRESALLSEKVEKNADDIKFRVIDPPYVPLKPTDPDKLVLNVMVLLAALSVGGSMSFLISLVKPVFVDRHTLSERLGLPILGCVTMISTPEDSRREFQRAAVFGSVFVCLILTFAGVNMGQDLIF